MVEVDDIPADPYAMEAAAAVAAAVAAEPWRLTPHAFAAHCSAGRWRAWPHLAYVGERIAEAVVAGAGRLIINMPPGYGKSGLLSHWTPAWLLDNLPSTQIILASHGAEFASEWGRRVRNEFQNNELLTTRLADDSQAADRWHTPEGGGMVTTGVGSGITGRRAHCILTDDPHPTWEAAMSRVHRSRAAEWYTGTLYDRGEPDATHVLLMHRWHPEDLAGFLMEHHGDQWTVIRLPEVAEAGDPLGRPPGGVLCPERFSPDQVAAKRRATPANVWAAKHQQQPLDVGGGRVYVNFSPDRNTDKALRLRPELPAQASFDFNYNPGMHAVVGQYDTAADVMTAVHEVHEPHMRLVDEADHPGSGCMSAVARLLDDAAGGPGRPWPWPALELFGDPAGHQNRPEASRTGWQLIRNHFEPLARRHGIRFALKVPAGQYPVPTRVETFNHALRDPAGRVHYVVHPGNCPRLMADLRELKADERGMVDKRDEQLSHATEAEANRVCRLRPVRRLVMTPGAVLSAGRR